MIIAEPSFEVTPFDATEAMLAVERAARTCYKSEAKVTQGSAEKLVRALISSGHHSVMEHRSITVRFIVDRGVSHCLVRHRIAAFSQESTQYCNYSRDRFDGQVTFIKPPWCENVPTGQFEKFVTMPMLAREEGMWAHHMLDSELKYLELISMGWAPQQARSVLPTSVKTELVMTCNLREWRHILGLRTSVREQKQVREVMVPLGIALSRALPVIFEGIRMYPWDYELRFPGGDGHR